VTPSTFLNPSPNFDSNQPGDGPPDDNGAVGPNNYIQIVNFTFQVFDKKGGALTNPIDPQTLWAGAPANDDCRVRGRGDVYVLYDHLADRWVISQFANHLKGDDPVTGPPLQTQCIAVSQGPDPTTGNWYAYTFFLTDDGVNGIYNDYPKLGLWPDGYYMISQRGYDGTSSLDAWVFDRANMLNGNPATYQHPSGFPAGEHDVIALPSDLTGPQPPNGSPNFYARAYDAADYQGDTSANKYRIEVFEFHTDWGVRGNTTFAKKQDITIPQFNPSICTGDLSLNQYLRAAAGREHVEDRRAFHLADGAAPVPQLR
jgi:hypothetical protein